MSGTRRSERIFGQIIYEKCVEAKVTAEESARLGEAAEHPGQPGSLHPKWRVPFQAAIHVEGKTDCEKDAALDFRFVPIDPILLFRRAQPDPDEIGREPIDFGYDFRFLVGREVAVARAHDLGGSKFYSQSRHALG